MDEDKKDNEEIGEDIRVEKEDLDDSVVSEEVTSGLVKKLRQELKEAQSKRDEYLAGWQRTQADFINFKKREALERQEFLKFASEDVIRDIVSAMDDFDAAFGNRELWSKVDKGWREGVERIHTRLTNALIKHGVAIIDPKGEMFSPAEHLAVEMVNVKTSEEDGKIVSVVNKGYSLNGRVIRPANVRVGQFGG